MPDPTKTPTPAPPKKTKTKSPPIDLDAELKRLQSKGPSFSGPALKLEEAMSDLEAMRDQFKAAKKRARNLAKTLSTI